MKINEKTLRRTYAVQGRGVYSKERNQKDIDIWNIDETDMEEQAVINEIAQQVYEEELATTKLMNFLDDSGLSYSAAAAVGAIVRACGAPSNGRHYSDRVEELDRAIEHIERIQARIMHQEDGG